MTRFFVLILALMCVGCVHQSDLDSWVGRPVEDLELHPFFTTLPLIKRRASDGTETWNFRNGACNNIFYIRDDVVITYAPTGSCRTGKIVRPVSVIPTPSKNERKQGGSADSDWKTEVYNIDLLKVTTQSRSDADFCASGSVHKILVEGQISPDSSFAMSRLLDRLQPCKDSADREIMPVTVSLKSGGGLLNDGYLMGETFRKRQVTTVVENGEVCASSCAVAFLGGSKRIVEDEGVIMYHAPYFTGENVYGKRDIDCEVGEEALAELNSYYREMTDAETGDRLFERTMWYCSAEDGWVVKGGSAAELFGIATEK